MNDPLLTEGEPALRDLRDPGDPGDPGDRGNRRVRDHYDLQETGFNEVPKKFRRFYRRWLGEEDVLAPNEVLCPVCKVVIRSTRALQPGDKVYCMPCMSRLIVIVGEGGRLEASVAY
ncbi:MAG: hypothetical protein ABR587_11495 [Candidatus Binatia bacterium]